MVREIEAWAARARGRAALRPKDPPRLRVGTRSFTIDEAVATFARQAGGYVLDLAEDDLREVLRDIAERKGGPSFGDPEQSLSPAATAEEGYLVGERAPTQSRIFGVTNTVLDVDQATSSYDWFGPAVDVMRDCAALGARGIRNLGPANLLWGELFPDPEDHPPKPYSEDVAAAMASLAIVPPPLTLYEQMVDGGRYTAMERFTTAALMAFFLELQLTPTIFSWGGGSRFSEGLDNNIFAGKPAHEVRALQVNVRGFDDFYHAPLDIGQAPLVQFEERYQRVALTVYAGSLGSPYLQEVARRKCLALAAFGQAIGEYFAELDRILGLRGGRLTDVVPVAELGVEYDIFWANYDVNALPVVNAANIQEGSRQLATFIVMLASSIHEGFPDIRFRAPPLASDEVNSFPSKRWGFVKDWIASLFRNPRGGAGHLDSVTGLLQRMSYMWANGVDDPSWTAAQQIEVQDWMRTGGAANFNWPPLAGQVQPFDATAYVHEVDLHWYRCKDRHSTYSTATTSGEELYQAQSTLVQEMAVYTADIVDVATRLGYDVRLVVSELGVAAEAPGRKQLGPGSYFADATPSYQAGMLVRVFLTFWATGVDSMNWHAFQGGVERSDINPFTGAYWSEWGVFSTMGLHNERWEQTALYRDWSRSAHAWRRPAWYTFRRLVALTNLADSCEILLSSVSLVVLRLTFSGAGLPGYQDSTLRHRYAYIAWKDYKTEIAELTDSFELEESGLTSPVAVYELLPMVPTLDDATRTAVDALGYPTGETIDWGATPHLEDIESEYAVEIIAGAITTSITLRVTVYASHPVTNPGPLVLLTSADWRPVEPAVPADHIPGPDLPQF